MQLEQAIISLQLCKYSGKSLRAIAAEAVLVWNKEKAELVRQHYQGNSG